MHAMVVPNLVVKLVPWQEIPNKMMVKYCVQCIKSTKHTPESHNTVIYTSRHVGALFVTLTETKVRLGYMSALFFPHLCFKASDSWALSNADCYVVAGVEL